MRLITYIKILKIYYLCNKSTSFMLPVVIGFNIDIFALVPTTCSVLKKKIKPPLNINHDTNGVKALKYTPTNPSKYPFKKSLNIF